MDHPEDPRHPLAFILAPMLLTFAIQRIFLHFFSHPNFHVYVGGFRVHHLFTGALIQISSAFLLAFGARARRLVLVALGIGSAMVLDEVFFLVFTDGSNEAYRGRVSFLGAAALLALAAAFLVGLDARAKRRC
ncbi:MAG TPA: hypothetical protein VNM14_25795 [Planctomycetota bacterium]|jgi:hypothetical protein|nr:hypothetical protein [Planctomycetota bacterium]